jgi:hypothetical protein
LVRIGNLEPVDILWRAAGSLSGTDLEVLQELFLASPASRLVVGRAVLDRRPSVGRTAGAHHGI